MKTMAAVPVRSASSSAIRQTGMVHCKIAYKQTLLRRFQHFIESTDWEEQYLYNQWIDKMCLGGIAASLIYFLPLLISIILE
jgi:hypothetical protein